MMAASLFNGFPMLYQIVSLLLEVVTGLVTGVCLLRLYMQHQRIPLSARSGNPMGPFMFAMSDWLVLPLRRVLPSVGAWDLASLLAALLVQLVLFGMQWLMLGGGAGWISVPVLAGSAAYAAAETMGWKEGLERTTGNAPRFYGVIAVSVLLGLGLQYSPISPMRALFWSAVINGVVAVPLMVVIILLASKKSVMGAYTASRPIRVLGWLATGIMGVAAACMFLPG